MELLRIQIKTRRRSEEFKWHGCVATVPEEAGTGFEEARGDFFAHPTGRCKMSRRRRASHSRRGRARPEPGGQPKSLVPVSDSAPRCKNPGLRRGATGRPKSGFRTSCGSLISVFLCSFVASRARCQRRLGVNPIPAITGQGCACNCSSLAGENGACAPFGAGSAPSTGPGHKGGYSRRGASQWAGAQQGG